MHRFAEELIESLDVWHKEFLVERDNLPNDDVWAIKKRLEDFKNTVAVTHEERR